LQNSLRRIGQASRCSRLTAKLTGALVQPLIYLVSRSNRQHTRCPGPAANLPGVPV